MLYFNDVETIRAYLLQKREMKVGIDFISQSCADKICVDELMLDKYLNVACFESSSWHRF